MTWPAGGGGGAGAGAAAKAAERLRMAGQFITEFCFSWPPQKRKNAGVLLGCFAFAATCWSCNKRVPGGYVALIQYRDGSVTPYLWEEKRIFPFLPYYQTPVTIRTMPAFKKMSRICKTKDGRDIEVAVRIRIYPKIAYVPEIYLRFGREFARAFLNKELTIDIDSLVSEHTYAELIKNDANTEAIEEELIQRFHDAAAFHKLVITEATVLFRHPDDEEG